MTEAKKENLRRVVTGEVRASYAFVFALQKDKYSITILIPKSDKATAEKIKKAKAAAALDGPRRWGGPIQAPKFVLHDGDGTRPSDGQPFGDECKGHYVMTASNKNKPVVVKKVNGELVPITDSTEFYSGCFCKVSFDIYPYAVEGNKGLAASLNSVLFTREGERLDNRSNPNEDYANEEDSAGSTVDDDLLG